MIRRGVLILLLVTSLGGFYLLLRSPTWHIYLPYYDDAETLYHVLSLSKGEVPYRDNYNHHFPGYLFPFLLGAPLFGFSSYLIQEVTAVLQVLNGVVCFFLLRTFASPLFAYLGALLLVSAREPWVIGFYPQFETNLVYLSSLLLTLKFIGTSSSVFLFFSALLVGLGFIADQRALLLFLIPVSALLVQRELILRRLTLVSLGTLLPTLLVLLYLFISGGIGRFIEQTFIFPTQFRAGSKSFGDFLRDGLEVYAHIWEKTPLHALLAVSGLLLFAVKGGLKDKKVPVVLVSFLPMLGMPLLGGRNFDYYTIVVFPLLSLAAVLSTPLLTPSGRRVWAFLMMTPLLLSFYHAISLSLPHPVDGVKEITRRLEEKGVKEREIYMWGYRLDVYTELGLLAHNPFASRIFVHPDHAITGEARLKHIYPKYESEFFERMKAPPRFIVLFNREGYQHQGSPADSYIRQLLKQRYELSVRVIYQDFLGKECVFDLYERVSNPTLNDY